MFEPVTITSTMVATGWPAVCGVGVGVDSCACVPIPEDSDYRDDRETETGKR